MKNALKNIHLEEEFDSKSYLLQISKIKTRLNAKIKQLDELHNFKSISGINYDKPFSKNKNISDQISNVVVKLTDLEIEIKSDIYDYTVLKDKIIDEIYNISDISSMNLLMMRYVDMMSLEKIAVELNFSYHYVRHLHSVALKKFKTSHTMSH